MHAIAPADIPGKLLVRLTADRTLLFDRDGSHPEPLHLASDLVHDLVKSLLSLNRVGVVRFHGFRNIWLPANIMKQK